MHNFEENIIKIYGDRGKNWLSELSIRVKQASELWDLTDLRAVDNLSSNYVLSGFQNKKPIILKLTLESRRLKKEAHTLKAFSKYGAVPVLAETDHALLLERILPGYSLETYLPARKNEALKVICHTMKRLHQAPLPESTFLPHIKDLMTILDKDWDIPKEFLEKARYLKSKLLETDNKPVLLHGDLRHSNILSTGREWCVIDPHGVVGYPVNEAWAFVIDPIADTHALANFFNLDVKEVREWYFVHLILLVCWNLNDNQNPAFYLDMAKKTLPTIQS